MARILFRVKGKWNATRDRFNWWMTNTFISNCPFEKWRKRWLKHCGLTTNGKYTIMEGFHIRNPYGITIEDGVSIGPKVLLDGRRGLHIGKSAVIAYEAIIWTLNHDYNDINFKSKGAPVEIGEYAWICSRSIILPGISVGKGAVVASGAIVTKDVPDWAIVAGVPAKVVGQREIKEYSY